MGYGSRYAVGCRFQGIARQIHRAGNVRVEGLLLRCCRHFDCDDMKKALLFFIVLLSLVSCSRKTTSVEKEFMDSVRIERRDTLIQRQILTIADTVYLSDTVFISELKMVTVDADGKVLRTDTEREKKIISNRNAKHYVNAKQEERQTSVTDKEETRKEKENKTVKEKPPILQRFKDSLFQFAAVLLMIIGAWYYFVYSKRSRSKNNP